MTDSDTGDEIEIEDTEHSLGFSDATEVQPAADFSSVDPPEIPDGWQVETHTQERFVIETEAGYRITAEGTSPRVRANLPPEDTSGAELVSERIVQQTDSVEDAIESATNVAADHPVNPEADLVSLTGISKELSEYLQMTYRVHSTEALAAFVDSNPDEISAVVPDGALDNLSDEL